MQAAYFEAHGRKLLLDYLALELERRDRLVCENESWVALTPFWAVWPFETMVLPRRAVSALPDLSDDERDALADILKRLTTRYDNLFEVSFPYSMGWHQRPTDGRDHPGWQLHAHFYPPLLRSRRSANSWSGSKCSVSRNDIPAEAAAACANNPKSTTGWHHDTTASIPFPGGLRTASHPTRTGPGQHHRRAHGLQRRLRTSGCHRAGDAHRSGPPGSHRAPDGP